MDKQLEIYRKWQKENPDWELICDIEDTDRLYVGWNELSKSDRMSWIGTFRGEAKEAFEEFGNPRCKVERKCLTEDLTLCDILDWPHGFNMTVFKTSENGVRVI